MGYFMMFFVDIEPIVSLKSLLSHNDKLSVNEKLEQVVNSLLLAQCLVTMGFINDLHTSIAVTFFKYLGIVRYRIQVYIIELGKSQYFRCNGHQVDDGKIDEGGCQVLLHGVGSAIYPVLPLLNHSCDPNTVRVYVENKVMLMATR